MITQLWLACDKAIVKPSVGVQCHESSCQSLVSPSLFRPVSSERKHRVEFALAGHENNKKGVLYVDISCVNVLASKNVWSCDSRDFWRPNSTVQLVGVCSSKDKRYGHASDDAVAVVLSWPL